MLAPSQACRLTRFNVRLWGPLHGARHPPPRLHCEHGDARPTVWPGLEPWRQSGVNELRGWGRKGPQSVPITPGTPAPECRWRCLADAAVAVLQTPDPAQKAALTHAAWHAVSNGSLPVGGEPAAAPPPFPARPPRPQVGMGRGSSAAPSTVGGVTPPSAPTWYLHQGPQLDPVALLDILPSVQAYPSHA
uniref:Uncharacterized protein n=1 Tax=Auxenochlorella protothecoides TaxID=3075 RepID=A0A1D2AF31_AUXPR